MTIFDLCCDRCGRAVMGPAGGLLDSRDDRGVRFAYHPGDPAFADNSSLVCTGCWSEMVSAFKTPPSTTKCAVCDKAVESSLFIQAGPDVWRLCLADAVEFLNALRTVEPKLDPTTFVLPGAGPNSASS